MMDTGCRLLESVLYSGDGRCTPAARSAAIAAAACGRGRDGLRPAGAGRPGPAAPGPGRPRAQVPAPLPRPPGAPPPLPAPGPPCSLRTGNLELECCGRGGRGRLAALRAPRAPRRTKRTLLPPAPPSLLPKCRPSKVQSLSYGAFWSQATAITTMKASRGATKRGSAVK